MYQGKWEDLVDKIEKLFGFIDHTTEEYSERRMTVETVVFDGASGRMKLERTVKPVVLDEKATYSKRIGGGVSFDYVLSEDEYVDTVKLYRWDRISHEWRPLDMADLGR